MIAPPDSLLRPIDVPRKLLMGPGPSNAPPRILAAGALPLLGHLHPEFTHIMDEVKAGLQYLFQTSNQLTLAISGTGHAAMEAACCNMVEPGDVVLVATKGIWGERFADMADRHGADVRQITRPMGEVFTNEELEEALARHRPRLMFITQGESSGTTLQPLDGLGQHCHKHDCLLIVDSVAALGGVPMFTDRWAIDVAYSGSQKVLSAPPGTAPITFSQRAWEKIKNRKSKVRSFYFDMDCLANYWGCGSEPRRYHHTGPISSIYALREALAIIAEEGLESSWKRHKECAELLHTGLQEMGLKLYVKRPEDRLPLVTAVEVPENVDWKAVSLFAMKKYRVEVAGGLGALAGRVWRVGVMGYNAQPDSVRLLLRALRDALNQHKSQL